LGDWQSIAPALLNSMMWFVHTIRVASISVTSIPNRLSLTMKASWASILGALEGAVAAAFFCGLLVGILGWRLDSAPEISAFLAAMLLGAIAGWSIGAKVARRRAARSAPQARSI
jgi:hypothetical protein